MTKLTRNMIPIGTCLILLVKTVESLLQKLSCMLYYKNIMISMLKSFMVLAVYE